MSNQIFTASDRSGVVTKASVAMAVASMCAGVASATTITARSATTTPATAALSAEGAARVAATQSTALGLVTMVLGATYEVNDELTLTIGGTSGAVRYHTDSAGTFSCATGGDVWSPITALNTNTTRVFRFAPTASTSALSGAVCSFNDAAVLDTSAGSTVGNTVTLQVRGRKVSAANANYNTEGSAAVVATVVDEYQVAVATAGLLNGSVDARKSNKIYTDGPSDQLTITMTNLNVMNDFALAGSTNAVAFTLTGDFSYLLNGSETTGAASAFVGANSVATNSGALGGNNIVLSAVGTAGSITGVRVTLNGADFPSDETGSGTLGIIFAGTDASTSNSIVAQSFAGDLAYSLSFASGAAETTNTTTGAATINAGTWTSTGATIFVPYMPIGSSIVPNLYWVNNSSASGQVVISLRGESLFGACPTSATVAISAGMTNLSGSFTSLVTTCTTSGYVSATDKVFVTLVGTTPIGSSEVYSSFNVGGSSRVTVPNSSTGYKGNPPTAAANTAGVSNADNNQR